VVRDSRLDRPQQVVRGRGLGSRVAVLVAAALWVPNVLAAQNSDTSGVRLFEAGKFKEAKTVFEPASDRRTSAVRTSAQAAAVTSAGRRAPTATCQLAPAAPAPKRLVHIRSAHSHMGGA